MNSQEQTTSGPDVEHVVRELASWERPSASAGERRAAEWIAERLRELGVDDVRLEDEPAHGGYWWPLGILSFVSGLAALAGGRLVRLVVGASRRSGSGTSSACIAASGRALRPPAHDERRGRRARPARRARVRGRHRPPRCGALGRDLRPDGHPRGRPEVSEGDRSEPLVAADHGTRVRRPDPRRAWAAAARRRAVIRLGGGVCRHRSLAGGPGANDNLSGVAALDRAGGALAAGPPADVRRDPAVGRRRRIV